MPPTRRLSGANWCRPTQLTKSACTPVGSVSCGCGRRCWTTSPDQAAVTDALRDTIGLPVELSALDEQLADLLEHAISPAQAAPVQSTSAAGTPARPGMARTPQRLVRHRRQPN